MNEKLAQKLAFVFEADKLKSINRRNRVLHGERHENTAEHSWHSTLTAMVFSAYAPAETNMLKVLQLITLHDIVEIYAGDTFFYDPQANIGKLERETEALHKITALLPNDKGEEFRTLWLEFEARETPEAIFANAIDQLIPVLINAENGGLSWTEARVTKEQVMAKRPIIEKASPQLALLFDHAIAKAVEKKLLPI